MRHEGFRDLPYHCSSGKLTIGYGHNLEKPISQKAAEQILMDDMLEARKDCFKVFPDLDTFSQGRQDAFVNMMFNLGLTRFKGFKKMVKARHDRDWETL
jgi:lysozyme